MKTHTEIGYAILKEPKDSTLAMAQDIALYHHEKFDGTGYPKGLKGSQIPVSARIMAISDVYDALRSDRPYKKGFSHKETLKIMTKGDSRVNGGHFDPEILNVFLRYNDIFEDIYTRGEI
jgi:putative two-component system response regulator